jgi:hypothetical protein
MQYPNGNESLYLFFILPQAQKMSSGQVMLGDEKYDLLAMTFEISLRPLVRQLGAANASERSKSVCGSRRTLAEIGDTFMGLHLV